MRASHAWPVSRSDVVRRFYRALNQRDLDALLDTLDPDIEFEPLLGVLYDRHVFHGHDEITQWYDQLAAQWDAFDGSVQVRGREAWDVAEELGRPRQGRASYR